MEKVVFFLIDFVVLSTYALTQRSPTVSGVELTKVSNITIEKSYVNKTEIVLRECKLNKIQSSMCVSRRFTKTLTKYPGFDRSLLDTLPI